MLSEPKSLASACRKLLLLLLLRTLATPLTVDAVAATAEGDWNPQLLAAATATVRSLKKKKRKEKEGVSPSFHPVFHQSFPLAAFNWASWQGSLGNAIHRIPATSNRAVPRMAGVVLSTSKPATSTRKN